MHQDIRDDSPDLVGRGCDLDALQRAQRLAGAGVVAPDPVVPGLGDGAVLVVPACGRFALFDAVVVPSFDRNIMKMPKITASAMMPPTIQLMELVPRSGAGRRMLGPSL
jgi:hypothetical protein